MRAILIAVVALVIVGAAAAALYFAKVQGGPEPITYKVVFDNAFGLVPNAEVRVGGVKAGSATQFAISESRPPKVIVTVEIKQPGFGAFGEDAFCETRPQSLISNYFIDCQPGRSPRKLASGQTIPVTQTATAIAPDLIMDVMRRPYRERLRLLIAELGTGLAGRPEDVNATLRRANPAFRETRQLLRTLGDQNQSIKNTIRDGDTVVSALNERKSDVLRFVREAGNT